MAKLDRAIALIHMLSESSEGLTLDEMADKLQVNRRTAERLRDGEVVLRFLPAAVPRARAWRFHPAQTVEQVGDELLIRFHAGGLRELADHLFTWGGDVRIEAPEALREVMRERAQLALEAAK